MHIGPWKQEDGYVEAIVSWEENCSPIAYLRAVQTSNGDYEAIIRDANTGKMLSSSGSRTSLDNAKILCVEKLLALSHVSGIANVLPPIPPSIFRKIHINSTWGKTSTPATA
jgi:hypothetical protein